VQSFFQLNSFIACEAISPMTPLPVAHATPLSKEEINTLPIRRYAGAIHIISTRRDLAKALQALRGERVLGFDTETKPTFRRGPMRPPALLQLATSEAAYLFQLKRIELPAGLRSILADPDIVKAGVAVHDDIRDLQRVSPFTSAGFVDLSQVARGLGVIQSGLRSMAARFLGFRVSKKAQCSNWEAKELSPSQIVYAATDAWVSRELHLHFTNLSSSC
jgi:ribonuclease D